MAESLNVIALISGGKDSFFSILHCLHNNHRVVALANVYPPATPHSVDLDSYMYQTVGHAIIPFYEKALGLPLFRREISGSAVNREENYEPALGPGGDSVGEDETESLSILLTEIISHLPEANAVCSGAILSTYQRTRVESVATRLGLTALSYLWQYPSLPVPVPSSGGLLNDIAAVGLDARIVKVASGGLDEDLLWGSLKDEEFRKKLGRHVARFGGSELGEGGEYETLVVGGPKGFWNSGLEVGKEKRHIVTGEGGQSFIAFNSGAVVERNDQSKETIHWRDTLKIPSIWDEAFGKLLSKREEVINLATGRALKSIEKTAIETEWIPEQQVNVSSRSTLIVSNVIARDSGSSTEEQMLTVKANILELFRLYHRSAQDVLFTMIILRSMADFVAVNAVYSTMFMKPNPPARVTVACGDTLPENVNVMIHLIMSSSSDNARKGLHVQSRSYWAPANIGPYSQAIRVPFVNKNKGMGISTADDYKGPSTIYVAGQIPLIPASMQTYSAEGTDDKESGLGLFWGQTCLALQHLWRVSKATKVTWWASGIAFFVGKDDQGKGNNEISNKAILTWLAWSKVHERELWNTEEESQEEDEPDVWDKRYGRHQSYATEEEEEALLPDFQCKQRVQAPRIGSASSVDSPPFLAVQVDELPQGCSVEWQCLGLDLAKAKVELVDYTGELLQGVVFHHCYIPDHGRTISIMTFPAEMDNTHLIYLMSEVSVLVRDTRSATFYTTRAVETTAQIVPCRSLWGKDGKQLSAALVFDSLGSPVLHA